MMRVCKELRHLPRLVCIALLLGFMVMLPAAVPSTTYATAENSSVAGSPAVGEAVGSESSDNIELVGQWPIGPTYTVTGAVYGSGGTAKNVAFVGAGAGVIVLEIVHGATPADPVNINKLAEFATQDEVKGLFYSSGKLYIANGSSGLGIFDVTDPLNPSKLDSLDTPGYASSVFVAEGYAYVADGEAGLTVINLALGTSVTYDTPGFAYSVFVQSGKAYVADGYAGLRIIPLSSPLSASSIETNGSALDVYISGGSIYVADWSGGLAVFSLSNPSAAPLVIDWTASANGVVVVGNYAYVANASFGLFIIDLTNPTGEPVVVDRDGFMSGYAYEVYVSNGYAYLADGNDGFKVINDASGLNSTPAVTPDERGSFETGDFAGGVFVSGDSAYVADGAKGLRILDVSNATDITAELPVDTDGFSRKVFVSGGYAYVADGKGGLVKVQLSDSGVQKISPFDSANGVYVAGNYVYVADGYDGLRIVNTTTLAVCTVDTPGYAQGVYVDGNYAYVADGRRGLAVVDISNPDLAALKLNQDTPGDAKDVFVLGQKVYVADGSSGLCIFDVSNPLSPVLEGSFDTSGTAKGVFVTGTSAYIADGTEGLKIIDVSAPAAPLQTAFYKMAGDAGGVYCSGGKIYVAAGYTGLWVFQLKAGVETADLSVTKSDGPDPLLLGGELTYSIRVVNNGPNDAAGVVLKDSLPQGVNLVSSPVGCSVNGQDITCNIGTLAKGGVANFKIVVKPTAAGRITNTATVGGAKSDPDMVNNTSTTVTTVQEMPTVSISAKDSQAYERKSDPGVFLISRTGDRNKPLTVYYTIGGEAKNGTDYKSIYGQVVIPWSKDSVLLKIVPYDDRIYDPNETVIVSLKASPDYKIGTGSATVSIVDNDPAPPTVTIHALDGTAKEEGREPAQFRFTRSGNLNKALWVKFSINGTARNRIDYKKLANTVKIPRGEASATVVVVPRDDNVDEPPPNETVILKLLPQPEYFIGFPDTATISILDND